MANYTNQIRQRANARVSFSSSSSLAAAPRRVSRVDSHVDILPPELLSYIFILGEQAERFAQTKQSLQHVRFQELTSQVCSRWRAVAINNPELWSWISIKRPSHGKMTVLYLVRAGSTVLLDIEIEMRSGFWDQAEIAPTDWATQLGYTLDLIEFLKAHGASPGRWRTLSIWARQPEPLFEVIAFLHRQDAPMLQCLSLKWASTGVQQFEESRALDGLGISSRSFVLSNSLIPNLRHVELTSVPWPFVLDRPSPLFTGLRSLSLTAASRLYSMTKLTALLRGNPRLESLQLGSGPNDLDNVYVSDGPLPSVCLPALQSLSLRSTYHRQWILDVLKAIQTPNLKKFALATDLYDDYSGSASDEITLLGYLSGGSSNGGGNVNGSSSGEAESLYPSLYELDVSRVACSSERETMVTLLASFPSVNRLSIASHHINCLYGFPWVLPKLESLVLNGYPDPELGSILRRRAAAGHPVRIVELRGDHSWDQESRDAYISALPNHVTAVDRLEPERPSDDDESMVEDWGDEVDDEDAGGYSDVEDEWMEGAELSSSDNGLEHEDYEDYNEEEEEEEEEGEGYEPSSGYDVAEGYSEDIYLPACWIDDNSTESQAYGLEDLYVDGWPYSDSNPFIGEFFSDEHADVEGYHEGHESGGYEVEDPDSDGGEDLEGGGSNHGDYDDDYGGDYDYADD